MCFMCSTANHPLRFPQEVPIMYIFKPWNQLMCNYSFILHVHHILLKPKRSLWHQMITFKLKISCTTGFLFDVHPHMKYLSNVLLDNVVIHLKRFIRIGGILTCNKNSCIYIYDKCYGIHKHRKILSVTCNY